VLSDGSKSAQGQDRRGKSLRCIRETKGSTTQTVRKITVKKRRHPPRTDGKKGELKEVKQSSSENGKDTSVQQREKAEKQPSRLKKKQLGARKKTTLSSPAPNRLNPRAVRITPKRKENCNRPRSGGPLENNEPVRVGVG